MDYEAAYKQAKNLAEIFAREGKVSYAFIERVFPELKESEDERIRKELIEFIELSVSRRFMREDFHQAKRPSEWIAWLERQKEQDVKVISWREPDDCADIPEGHYVVIAYKPGVFGLGYIGNGKVVCAPGQKPSGILYIPNADESIIVESKEQEPIATEDEKDFLEKEVKAFLCNYDNEFDDDAPTYDIAEHFYQLGKNSQKPAEWSEEDRKMLDAIIKRYSFPIETDFSVFVGEDNLKDMREELGWLKSLRPQPHWKPSERQIEALKETAEWKRYSNPQLFSLYEDLKKLL